MRELVTAFKNINPERISYYVVGESERECRIKDRLYERELKKLGYYLISSTGTLAYHPDEGLFGNEIRGEWYGPTRKWSRNRDRNDLEQITKVGAAIFSIVGLIGGLSYLSSNITGNVINSNNDHFIWIGGVLFIIGVLGAFTYFKIR